MLLWSSFAQARFDQGPKVVHLAPYRLVKDGDGEMLVLHLAAWLSGRAYALNDATMPSRSLAPDLSILFFVAVSEPICDPFEEGVTRMTVTPATSDDLNWIRVDQVGSLCPPRLLHQVFEEYKSGKISESVLSAAKNRAIEEIVYKQQKIGLPILSDGELRRRNFQESFSASVTGFEVAHENKAMEGISTRPLTRAEQDFAAAGPAIVTRRRVTERLRLERNVPLEEYLFASKYATSPVKVTVLSADRIAQRFAWEESRNIYATMDDFLADVVEISRLIIKGLVDAGCQYIQVDAPGYTAYVDDVSLGRMRSRGEDPMDNMDKAIAADNAIINGFENVTFGIHLCRGNPRTIDPETGKVFASVAQGRALRRNRRTTFFATQSPPPAPGIR